MLWYKIVEIKLSSYVYCVKFIEDKEVNTVKPTNYIVGAGTRDGIFTILKIDLKTKLFSKLCFIDFQEKAINRFPNTFMFWNNKLYVGDSFGFIHILKLEKHFEVYELRELTEI